MEDKFISLKMLGSDNMVVDSSRIECIRDIKLRDNQGNYAATGIHDGEEFNSVLFRSPDVGNGEPYNLINKLTEQYGVPFAKLSTREGDIFVNADAVKSYNIYDGAGRTTLWNSKGQNIALVSETTLEVGAALEQAKQGVAARKEEVHFPQRPDRGEGDVTGEVNCFCNIPGITVRKPTYG
jgi:hypothetical protein